MLRRTRRFIPSSGRGLQYSFLSLTHRGMARLSWHLWLWLIKYDIEHKVFGIFVVLLWTCVHGAAAACLQELFVLEENVPSGSRLQSLSQG